MNARAELDQRLNTIKVMVDEIQENTGAEISDEVDRKVEEAANHFREENARWSRYVGDLILVLLDNAPEDRLRPVLRKFGEELQSRRMVRSALDDIVAMA